MKGLMKMFSVGVVILKEWGIIVLLKWYMCKCEGSCLVGRLWKRWIDLVNNCLKKRGLNVGQARRMVYDKNEWWGFVRSNTLDIALGMNP